VAARPGLGAFEGRRLILGIRPEDMEDAALVPGAGPDDRFPVVVDIREGLGSDVYLHYKIEAPPVLTEDTKDLASDIDAKALEDLKTQASEHRSVFITRAGPETRARAGEQLEIHVDTRRLYFFDPATGASIYDDPVASSSGAAARVTT